MELNNNNSDLPGSERGIQALWLKFSPYWPIYLVIAALCLSIGWVYLYYKAPIYSANASILIKDKLKGYDDSKLVEDLNPLASNNTIENEMELMKSRTMMNAVVKKLHLYASVFENGERGVRSSYLSSPVTITVQDPEKIVESKKIPFKYDKQFKRVVLDGISIPLNYWVKTKYGTLKFLPNRYYSNGKTANEYFFILKNPDFLAADYALLLETKFLSKGSTVVDLAISDEVPQKAKDILNELITVYNGAALSEQNRLASNTLTFIDDRLKYVEIDLSNIEQKIQQYKANKGAVDINQQGLLYLENVNINDRKIGELNTQLDVLDQVENYVVSKNNDGAIVPSSLGITNSGMSELLTKLHNTQLEYAALKRTTASNNPILSALSDQIEMIKPGLLENIRNQRKNLQVSKDNTVQTNGAFSSMLQNIPKKERELIDINRQQNIKNNIYTFLLQKREEIALSYSSSLPESRVVDNAYSSYKPQSPLKRNIYLIAMVISMLLFFIWVYFKESFNNAILYRHEIESVTSIPVIGEIFFEKIQDPIVVFKDKQTAISQQFHKLRASLNFLGIDSNRKKILIASLISGEGKSFIAANLGVSLAIVGKRVALLELDLLNPTLSDKFDVSNSKGISDYLLNNASTHEIVVQTKVHENLFVVPSGPAISNSLELIMNGRIKSLFNDLESKFDVLIIDTAPIGPTTDAYGLTAFCDASLFVIRHGYTPKKLVARIDAENRINPLKNAAIIFNGVKSRGFLKNNYGFGYGYAYTYNEKSKSKRTKQLVVRRRLN